jgi:hypothetical protein
MFLLFILSELKKNRICAKPLRLAETGQSDTAPLRGTRATTPVPRGNFSDHLSGLQV